MCIFDPYFGRPWWLLLLIPVAALTVISYLRSRRRELIGGRWRTHMTLRLVSAALAVLIAADFSIVTNLVPVYTVVAVDLSDSMIASAEAALEDAHTLRTDGNGASLIFGGDAVIVEDFEGDAQTLRDANALQSNATDLATALSQAEGLFPQNVRRRLVLLTDGLETDGNASKRAAALAGKGTQIDALVYDAWNEGSEVEVYDLFLPREMALGKSAKASVTVQANAPTTIQLSLYDGEEQVYTNRLHIDAGTTDYTIRVTPSQSGVHVFRAQVEPEEDGQKENNVLAACVNVASSTKILLVDGTGNESAALSGMLSEWGHDVDVCAPKGLPPNTASLCKYGLVILMNVDVASMIPSAGAALSEYVSHFGGSVLLTGGENTFAYGHLHETVIEEFLPVSVQVEEKESANPVALMLLIDNSASMGEVGVTLHSESGRPIEMAKLGAIKSISLLNDNDYAGVISFSNKAHVLSPLRPAAERDEIIATVSRMGLISGTMYTEALTEAMNVFSAFEGTEKKHIIFLSDGSPSDDDFMPVVHQLADMGVTISTISVGDATDSNALKDMADATGGRFAQVSNVSDLPAMMASDTLLQQVEYTVEGAFQTIVSPQTALFSETDLPELKGYIRVNPKTDADVPLLTDTNHALYAQWHYGTGMAACFMSDLSGRWSSAWFREEAGQNAIADMINALMPEEQAYVALDMALTAGGKEALLSLDVVDASTKGNYEADVTGPDGETVRVRLVQMEAGQYERLIPLMGFGRYDITLRYFDEQGALIDTYETAVFTARSTEYEAFPSEQEKDMLSALSDMTGGQIYRSVQAVLDAPLTDLTADVDPSGILALMAALLFLAEVILRRFPVKNRKGGKTSSVSA